MAVWRIGLVGLSMDPRRGQSKTDERTVQLGSGDRSGSVRPYFLAVFYQENFPNSLPLSKLYFASSCFFSPFRRSFRFGLANISYASVFFFRLAKGVDQRVISSETLHDIAKELMPKTPGPSVQ